jgi:hypothetical protein
MTALQNSISENKRIGKAFTVKKSNVSHIFVMALVFATGPFVLTVTAQD